jgi:hypothetical protein
VSRQQQRWQPRWRLTQRELMDYMSAIWGGFVFGEKGFSSLFDE